MARGRSEPSVAFDVTESSDPDAADGADGANLPPWAGDLSGDVAGGFESAEPGRLALAGRALWARVNGWPRRRVVAVAVAFAVAVAVGPVVVSVRDAAAVRAWAAVAATAPGAVLDLGSVPGEEWRTPIGDASPVALVGDVLVVTPRVVWAGQSVTLYDINPATGEFLVTQEVAPVGQSVTLIGIDPATGEELWSVQVDDVVQCDGGPGLDGAQWSGARVVRTTAVVCRSQDQRRVAVVDAEGNVTTRTLADLGASASAAGAGGQNGGAGDGDSAVGIARPVTVLADGDILRVERIGPMPPAPVIRSEGNGSSVSQVVVFDQPLVTRDVILVREDAATGEQRWSRVLDSLDAPAGEPVSARSLCVGRDQAGGAVADAVTHVFETAEAGFVRSIGCGLDAVVDLGTGAVVDQRDVFAADYSGWIGVWYLAAGPGIVARTDQEVVVGDTGVTTRFFTSAGTLLSDVPGTFVVPVVTDGSPAPLLVLESGSIERPNALAAYDSDSLTLRFRVTLADPSQVLAVVAGVIIAWNGRNFVGLDAATGAELWTVPVATATGRPASRGFSFNDVLTDGHRIILVGSAGFGSQSGPDVPIYLAAIDVATGANAWSTAVPGPAPVLVAGRLIQFQSAAIVGLR
jgi:outer membrane protein assembly factor BamB